MAVETNFLRSEASITFEAESIDLFVKLVNTMKPLYKNMIVFTLVLTALTLSVEWFRNGKLEFEQPLIFAATIILLGCIGGYIGTWTNEK